MADITIGWTITVDKDPIIDQWQGKVETSMQSALAPQGGGQLIGTTHEAVSFADIVTAGGLGIGIVGNTDPTNFIDVGIEVAGTFHA